LYFPYTRTTITVTVTIQKKITFTGTIKITVLHKKGKERHYVHNHSNLRKKGKGGETLAKFSFTECLARFFPFLIVLKKLVMFSCNLSLYLINCVGLGYENFQRRIRAV